ncbi:GMC oxidoreductase [Apiospora saccharicola]|uniref:GMC oxidoreductase n=1 Tax=Apiospora saccharicola TaxID=335842 RepID=A0ABR1U698_9PEZI
MRQLITAAAIFAHTFATSHPGKNHQAELRGEYALIIARGGTAGLTVADRLTEAFPDLNVLVEYGDIEPTPGYFEPPGSPPQASNFSYTVPAPTLNNRSAEVRIDATVGGCSAINGQFFDRASRHDYDDWDRLAGDRPTEGGWLGRGSLGLGRAPALL